ncbi:MAG TPA: hypothetical protein PLL69_00010 [Gemmatimonadales bacterium]|nr:hypothetical protein [Gemmatimonadales bacterium]
MMRLHSFAVLLLLAGCAASPSPRPGVEPADEAGRRPEPVGEGPARVALAAGYSSTASLVRRDSVILALPDGGRQVQRLSRRASFSVTVSPRNEVRVQLDSIEFSPSAGGREREAIGTVWQGRLTNQGLTGVRANRRSTLVAELTQTVIELFPAVPAGGVVAGESWADTTKSKRQVEIFEASDERTSSWNAGRRTTRDRILVQPISSVEIYQQLGSGEQADREMRMSAEGRRSATYYLTLTGRPDAIVSVDSATRLITIPSTRQAIPTTQVARTRVEFR